MAWTSEVVANSHPHIPLSIINNLCRLLGSTNQLRTLSSLQQTSQTSCSLATPHLYRQITVTRQNCLSLFDWVDNLPISWVSNDDDPFVDEFELKGEGLPKEDCEVLKRRLRRFGFVERIIFEDRIPDDCGGVFSPSGRQLFELVEALRWIPKLLPKLFVVTNQIQTIFPKLKAIVIKPLPPTHPALDFSQYQPVHHLWNVISLLLPPKQKITTCLTLLDPAIHKLAERMSYEWVESCIVSTGDLQPPNEMIFHDLTGMNEPLRMVCGGHTRIELGSTLCRPGTDEAVPKTVVDFSHLEPSEKAAYTSLVGRTKLWETRR